MLLFSISSISSTRNLYSTRLKLLGISPSNHILNGDMLPPRASLRLYIQTAALAEVKTPTPHYHVMSCKPSQEQIAYMDKLCDRAEAVEKRKVKPEIDNMLKITGDGSKSSMHTKLVSPNASEWLDNKLLACAWNVWQIWTITAICKGTQAIFCDRNAPKKDKWNRPLAN